MGKVGLLLLALLLAACTVDRTDWQRMSPTDKTLYVKSLLGAEKAKEAKGGNTRTYPLPAEEYVRRIDEAYARGDGRTPEAIFAAQSTPRAAR